ncbi:MAG: PEP-CTERM sorting domain-containing protein, partial [Pirellulales bacterium]|nr:PEP-CTERM sorting domain-containing protein [Pirellulales bacterium]
MALLATHVAIAPAFAGTIVSASPASGPGVGLVAVPNILTTTPNNDNEAGPGSNNISIVVKRFDANGFIDIEFNTTPSDVVTEYLIFEAVDNNTGVPWAAYTMQLGFGTGANFQQSPAGDGLDFDAPQFDGGVPSSTAFPSVVTGEDLLTFGGGVQGAGLQTYRVRIDVPDFSGQRLNRFTLRQTPVAIPEPATLALAGVAMIGVLCVR